MLEKYKDIINMSHHVSTDRRRMMMKDRAAQFAPFAALNGYEEAVEKAGIKFVDKAELSRETMDILNRKLEIILNHIEENPEITVIFFQENSETAKGRYLSFCGRVLRIDEIKKEITFCNEFSLPIENIYDITGALTENDGFFD